MPNSRSQRFLLCFVLEVFCSTSVNRLRFYVFVSNPYWVNFYLEWEVWIKVCGFFRIWLSNYSSTISWKTILSPLSWLCIFVESLWPYRCGSSSGVFVFRWSACLVFMSVSYSLGYTSFIISLKGSISPLCFFLKLFWLL